jgi:site-specific recombinase XerD
MLRPLGGAVPPLPQGPRRLPPSQHDGRHRVEQFLTHLAVDRHVSASTQNQALNGLVFLYREVLRQERNGTDAARARRSRRLPVVLSRDEARQLLEALDRLPTTEPYPLMDRLMAGAGLWLMECCRLRVQNVDSCQRSVMLAIHCWLSIIAQPGVHTSCL